MTQAAIATSSFFQTRDLFVHDGNHLRRLRLSAPAQMAMLVMMALLFTWSAYSAVRLVIAPTGPSTRLSLDEARFRVSPGSTDTS